MKYLPGALYSRLLRRNLIALVRRMELNTWLIKILLTALFILTPFLLLALARFYFGVVEPYRQHDD